MKSRFWKRFARWTGSRGSFSFWAAPFNIIRDQAVPGIPPENTRIIRLYNPEGEPEGRWPVW